MVGSQTASLTPGPSFAHNLGFRCPNDQCEGILDIYTSRPFQWHQEHPNARCFGLCCWTLNVRESRRTPNLQLWEWEFHPPTSPKVGLRHQKSWSNLLRPILITKLWVTIQQWLVDSIIKWIYEGAWGSHCFNVWTCKRWTHFFIFAFVKNKLHNQLDNIFTQLLECLHENF
jgi:hypothetical protein